MAFLKLCLAPVLSGILVGTSYLPFWPWGVFFCFVPLALFWQKHAHDLKRILFGGWLCSFILSLIGFWWIAETAHKFGRLPWPISLLVLLGFSSFANYFLMAAGALWWGLRRLGQRLRPNTSPYTLPNSTMVLSCIALCAHLPGIFRWHLGYTLMPLEPYVAWVHNAELVGIQGMGSLIVLSNIFALWGLRAKKILLPSLCLVSVWGGAHISGQYLKQRLPQPEQSLKVLVVQGNIGHISFLPHHPHLSPKALAAEHYWSLTQSALQRAKQKPDLILWPETALRFVFSPHVPLMPKQKRLVQKLQQWNLPLLTGAYSYDMKARQHTTAMVLLQNTVPAQQSQVYSKHHLLMFGEYVPGSKIWPSLRRLVPAGNFTPGPGAGAPFEVSFGTEDMVARLGAFICYESLFAHYVRDVALGGADEPVDVLVNITNDSWYDKNFEPQQHLYMTLTRAIELRRPLVRATNTGISTAVLANGRVLSKSPLDAAWTQVYDIAFAPQAPRTLYMNEPWLALALLVAFLFEVFIAAYLPME